MAASLSRVSQPVRASQAKRFTPVEKVNAVLRLLEGESVETLSRDLGVATNRLERWRNDFVIAGSAALGRLRGSGSDDWLSRHAAKFFQWFAFLVVMLIVVAAWQLFLHRAVNP